MNQIILNGRITYSECAKCGTEDIRIEHGATEQGNRAHYQHCPECGNEIVFVGWDCKACPEPPVSADASPGIATARRLDKLWRAIAKELDEEEKMYTRNNPKRVEAESVKRAGHIYVDVTVEGETFKACKRQWTGFFMEEDESYVLVQRDNGDWLRVCFYDRDVK